MILRDLLFVKQPLSDADALRCLACQALEGLARCPSIRQVMSKIPHIANNELQCSLAYILLHILSSSKLRTSLVMPPFFFYFSEFSFFIFNFHKILNENLTFPIK